MGNAVIALESAAINRMVTGLSAASTNINRRALSPVDGETTIPANRNAKDTFTNAQEAHSSFASALSKSGEQIATISNAFRTLDVRQGNQYNMWPT